MKTSSSALLALPIALALMLAGCSSSDTDAAADSTQTSSPEVVVETNVDATGCPAELLDVVVSVNQWGDIVEQLGGECANVTTILTDPNIDPHDYQPKQSDIDTFSQADMVVINGAGYDDWAAQAAAEYAPNAPVVNAGQLVGVQMGSNPHLWYSPIYVTDTADAVTGQMTESRPSAAAYFSDQRTTFQTDVQTYLDAISDLRMKSEGKSFAGTETIFNYMAAAVGLKDVTPSAYEIASINEQPQKPPALREFQGLLNRGKASVLIFNTQTSDPVAEELVGTAVKRGIPVVNVTETIPPQYSTFISWQMAQLMALSQALDSVIPHEDHDDHDHDHDHDDHD